MVERKKKPTYTFIVLTCCPCSTLTWAADHVVLFFISCCTRGAVVFEILDSHGMGEGRADCTKSSHSSRLHTTLWKHISDIKKKQSLQFETRQAQKNWTLMSIHLSRGEISAKPPQDISVRMPLKDTLAVQGEKFCYGNAVFSLLIKLWLNAWGSHIFSLAMPQVDLKILESHLTANGLWDSVRTLCRLGKWLCFQLFFSLLSTSPVNLLFKNGPLTTETGVFNYFIIHHLSRTEVPQIFL